MLRITLLHSQTPHPPVSSPQLSGGSIIIYVAAEGLNIELAITITITNL